jgi:hypothetical protein
MSPQRARIAKWFLRTAAAAALLTALIGFAHTPYGRPLLNALRGAPGCPVDLSGGDPKQVEAQRKAALRRRVGSTPELTRPAAEFALGQSTRAQVTAAMNMRAERCQSLRDESVFKCTLRANDARWPRGDAHFQFDAHGHLVALDVRHAPVAANEAFGQLSLLGEGLRERVGPVTQQRGARDAKALAQSYLRQSILEFRYKSYVAQLSATNFGEAHGSVVRESYQYLPNG